MKTITDFCVYLLVRTLFCVLQALSLKTNHAVAKALARFFTDVVPVRRKLLHENLAIAFPDLSDEDRRSLILRMWEHLFLMGMEVALSARKVRDLNWKKHIHLKNSLPLLRFLHQDRPLIIVTGHFGNFEFGGYTLGLLSYPTHSVARMLDNPFLNTFVKNFRESTGQFLISKVGGYDDILHVLENNGTMTFLADQSAGPKGCMVDFFGKKASTYKAIALLSLQFEAPIVICYALRHVNEKGEFVPMQFDVHIAGTFDPKNPLDAVSLEKMNNVKDITQWFTSKLEEGIRDFPEQYWWLHRRWKDYQRKPQNKNSETVLS